MKELTIIGFGSQAKAWAANLKDSGVNVTIALRKNSPSYELARKKGYNTIELESDELSNSSVFVLLTPDHTHLETLTANSKFFNEGSVIVYAHGYSYSAFDLKAKFPQLSHLMLAPKAIASELRFQFENEGKLGAVYSVEDDTQTPGKSRDLIFSIAKSIGITAGPYEASFLEETNADLFSEQSLLCSMLPYGALHAYNKLREKGVQREIAYLECWLEVKLIADAMVKMGPTEFFKLISPNALIGGEKARKVLFDKQYHEKLDSLANDIWNQDFFTECETLDFNQLRSDVLEMWEKEELSLTHNELRDSLINS
jgi:ketol-acid reductoisomerase